MFVAPMIDPFPESIFEEIEDCFFYVVFRKQICFGLEGVARDKLVFGILKHGHVSFQILTKYFCNLDFGTKPLIKCSLFFLLFIFISP